MSLYCEAGAVNRYVNYNEIQFNIYSVPSTCVRYDLINHYLTLRWSPDLS